MRSVFVLLAVLSVSCVHPAQAGVRTDRADTVASLVQAYHDLRGFNGVVLAAVGDTVVHCRGYGYAIEEHRIPNTPATAFRLASISKHFTAAAVLMLAERGELRLDEPIATYMPDLNPSIGRRVTLHHLLTHTSGLARSIEELTNKTERDHFTMSEMIRLINESALVSDPGARFLYSNLGYVLAAAVLESVTGSSYGLLMRELIFDPLNLADTDHETTGRLIPRRAEGLEDFPDGRIRSACEDKSYVTGAGSLYSTALDLFAWSRAVQTGRVLAPERLSQFTTAQTSGYAYGWFTFAYTCGPGTPPPIRGEAVTHDGGCPGFETSMRWYLDHGITVIVLANMRPFRASALANTIGNALLGVPDDPPSPARGNEIARLAIELGVEEAVRHAVAEAAIGRPLPPANELNEIGYRYLFTHRPWNAVRVQELQVGLYPDHANAHDSLGEACAAAGQLDRAIRHYERCLELEPGFPSAVQALRTLRPPAPDPG